MLQFVFSCMLLLSIVLWWAEAKYNFLHGIIMWLKGVCGWIKNQTKLKIDICKWFLPCIFVFGVIYTLYYPYFKQTLEFEQGEFIIKDYSEGSTDKELFQKQVPENIENEEKANPIGDWGTFGDFVGGTLNPIIGFISILLLFATWKLTRKTLDFTKEELKNSNQLLISQQFDSLFFNLLESFQAINKEYSEEVKEEDFYQKIFLDKESNWGLAKTILLIQYFSSLSILLKTINSKLEFVQDKKQSDELKSFYVDIVLSKISFDIQQIVALYAFDDDDLKIILENSGFFKKIDFKYYVDSKSKIFENYNFELLLNLHRYDKKIFHNSKNMIDLKKTYLYEIFFSNGAYIHQYFQNQYKKEIHLILNSGLSSKWNLGLRFEQDGLRLYDLESSELEPQTVLYNQMIFTRFGIKITFIDFFELHLSEGKVSNTQFKSNTAKLEKFEIQ